MTQQNKPANGLSKGAVGVIDDLGELEQMKSDLRQRNALIETLVRYLPASVFVKDARSWQYVLLNPLSEELFGIASEQALGKTDFELFDREFAQALRRSDEEALARPGVVDIPNRRVTALTGRESVVHTRKVAVRDAAGEPRCVIGMSLDVTDASRTEVALRASEARHTAILESALDAIVVNDEQGRITEFNPSAERMFGWSRQQAVGQDLAELIIPERLRHIPWDDRVSGIPQFQGRRVEVVALHADGHEFPLELTVQRIDQGGRMFFTAFARDISEVKRAQEALNQAKETLARQYLQLEEGNQYKTEFMANVTHELRTPLNSVIGFAELLKDEVPGPLNPKQAQFVADILAGGQSLLALVEGILEMSRLDVARAALEREPVEIGAMLEERVAAHRKAAEARRIGVALEVPADVGSAELDPQALRRIVDALLDNAIKFNHEGGEVAVNARQDDGWLEIAVTNTGIGIAPEDLAKLFKPLAQINAGLVRQHSGVGLGLALAHRLAQWHGGTIKVDSEPGKVSTFTLRLPLQEKS